jgi:hypothetical protein
VEVSDVTIAMLYQTGEAPSLLLGLVHFLFGKAFEKLLGFQQLGKTEEMVCRRPYLRQSLIFSSSLFQHVSTKLLDFPKYLVFRHTFTMTIFGLFL